MHAPYLNANFFEFFTVLGQRLLLWLSGSLSVDALAGDEIQLAVLALVSASSALMGSFLILRRMTMLANALSHTILIGIVGVFLWGLFLGNQQHFYLDMKMLLCASVGVGFLTTFLTHCLSKYLSLQQDASIGLVFTVLFALGILLLTLLTRDAHIGTEVVMGNVDALHSEDLFWVSLIFVFNMALIVLFYKEYLLTTFDSALASSLGFSVLFFDYLLMVQCSLTVVSGFRAVGVLMILALLTLPTCIARLWTHSLKRIICYAIAVGVATSIVGVALSRHLLTVYGMALSTAGLIVVLLTVLFIVSVCIRGTSSKRAMI